MSTMNLHPRILNLYIRLNAAKSNFNLLPEDGVERVELMAMMMAVSIVGHPQAIEHLLTQAVEKLEAIPGGKRYNPRDPVLQAKLNLLMIDIDKLEPRYRKLDKDSAEAKHIISLMTAAHTVPEDKLLYATTCIRAALEELPE